MNDTHFVSNLVITFVSIKRNRFSYSIQLSIVKIVVVVLQSNTFQLTKWGILNTKAIFPFIRSVNAKKWTKRKKNTSQLFPQFFEPPPITVAARNIRIVAQLLSLTHSLCLFRCLYLCLLLTIRNSSNLKTKEISFTLSHRRRPSKFVLLCVEFGHHFTVTSIINISHKQHENSEMTINNKIRREVNSFRLESKLNIFFFCWLISYSYCCGCCCCCGGFLALTKIYFLFIWPTILFIFIFFILFRVCASIRVHMEKEFYLQCNTDSISVFVFFAQHTYNTRYNNTTTTDGSQQLK